MKNGFIKRCLCIIGLFFMIAYYCAVIVDCASHKYILGVILASFITILMTVDFIRLIFNFIKDENISNNR